ncbi:hypothetical protein [Mesorhizobium sp. CAU 1741]
MRRLLNFVCFFSLVGVYLALGYDMHGPTLLLVTLAMVLDSIFRGRA